jgi:6-phosphofructokinase 1
MEELKHVQEKDLKIDSLGEARIPSPLGLSTICGDNVANYVEDAASVLIEPDRQLILERITMGKPVLAFEKAGPRPKIYFDPSKTRVAIVTCGGLCPGINNVIRSLVRTLMLSYGVKKVFGIRYGYQGFIPSYGHEPLTLDPEVVDDIHEKGGSILSSSRGMQSVEEIVDCLERMNISILFTIGGDGTIAGAQEIYEEVKKRGLKIAVMGIPKTIDNDISFVQKTFGLETAFEVAAQAIDAAHTEAKGAPFGIGLVKVMGRLSGFIAANAALALSAVNLCLIPELPFDLEGEKGLFRVLERRFTQKDHIVIIVAEGAGQKYVDEACQNLKDASGNRVLGDVGIFLKDALKKYFKEKRNIDVNLKYIDPSYMIRAVAANAHDAIFCLQLAQNAVHAAMAGKTGCLVGSWNEQFTHVPMQLAISKRKQLSLEDPLWLSVLQETGQPHSMINNGL